MTFSDMEKWRKAALLGSAATFAASLVFGLGVAPVSAQETADEQVEEVYVTGSRIKRADLTATSPVNVITTEALDLTGANSMATILNELPSAGVPGSVDTATNFRTSTSGLNTIDLRNLGTNRTLILVNGRRHVGGSAGSPTVDVSMIPAPLVGRVEVVTGGASAVYGSEAMSGVINFIMKRDFEGVEVNGRYGTSELGGATEQDISVMAGANFDGDRGNALVYVGYSDRGILRSNQREISANDAVNSSFGPKGNFFPSNFAQAALTQNETTGLWDKSFVAAEDGYNRNNDRLIRVPTERVQFNANISYKINDNMTFVSESAYSELLASSSLEPTITGYFISIGSIPNIMIPYDNPFVPTELRTALQAVDSAGAEEFVMFRRFRELGPRTSDVQRRQFRTLVGLEGEFGDGWSYDAYYQYGNNSQDQTNGGVFNALNFWQALQTEADGNGGYRCEDEVARSLGCVPINVFGRGSITGAALDWVSTDSQLTTRMTQHVAAASVSGSLFELPAGSVDVAMGVEWREEKSKYNSDSLAATGLTSGNSIPNTVGAYNVEELFAEAIVPLADGVVGEYLGLELAARYANYSTIGSTGAYKVGVDWRPMEDLMIRGGWSLATRAPNINELFDPGSETFRSFVDPCALGGKGGLSGDGTTTYTAQSASVQANCATYAGTATLDPFFLNIRSAGGLAAGNPDLKAEEAETYTIGAVYSPSSVPGLNMTVDYFDIKITDAISTFGAQTTVDQCVRQPVFPDNPFCSLITRHASTGLVLRIDAQAINAASLHTKGVDFALDYTTDLGEGTINLNLNGTYTEDLTYTSFDGATPISSIGGIGAPKWKANAAVTYDLDNWRFGWSTRFIDNVLPDPESPTAFGGPVGTFLYNDIQARYSFGDSGQYELFAGVDNVFDKEPPFLGQGRPGDVTGTNTAADVYDAIRRYVYAGFRAKF